MKVWSRTKKVLISMLILILIIILYVYFIYLDSPTSVGEAKCEMQNLHGYTGCHFKWQPFYGTESTFETRCVPVDCI